MRKLANKQTKIENGEGGFVKYSNLITNCLNVPPVKGFTREDFKVRDRIEASYSDNDEEINLEDSDAANLKKIVSEIAWSFRHKDLTNFINDIEKL